MPAGPTSATSASAGWIRRRSRPRTTRSAWRVPSRGLCPGLRCGATEAPRDVAGASGANSTEFDLFTDHPVIDFMPDQRELEDKGGTMRLGLYSAKLPPGAKAAEA